MYDTMSPGMNVLSGIVETYIQTVTNPFDGPLGTVTNAPVLLTSARRVWVEGDAYTSNDPGAGGFGFVVISPYAMAVNNQACCFSVDATNTYAAAAVTAAAGVGTVAQNSNSDFPLAALSPNGVTMRLVGVGLEVTATTVAVNRGGSCYGLVTPAHGTLDGMGIYLPAGNNLVSYAEHSYHSVSSPDFTKVTALYTPAETFDYDFHAVIPAANAANGAFMGFMFQAPGGANGQSFHFRAYAVIEYQGTTVTGRTMSLDDPVGQSAAAAVVKHNFNKPHVHKDHKKVAEASVKATNHYVKHNVSGHHHPRRSSSSGSDILGTIGTVASAALPLIGMFL